jgi:hypothetical protein
MAMTIEGLSFCSMNLQLLSRHYLSTAIDVVITISTIVIAIFSIFIIIG